MGLFDAVVDPMDITHWWRRAGINAYKPALQARVRLVKAIQVRRIRPNEIVLGTSRSHVGLRMTHPGWPPGVRYNLGFDGATPEEMYAYLRHAQANAPLRLVVLGLDTWQIEGAPSSVRPDFDPTVLEQPDAPLTVARADLAELRILLSLDTLAASIETLRSQDQAGADWFAPDGQRLGPVFFRRPGEDYQAKGPTEYFLAVDRQEIGFKLPEPAARTAGPIRQAPAKAVNSFDYIRKIVEFCRDEGIDLRIFITPAHAHQMEISSLMGEWGAIERGKRRLVTLLATDGPGGGPLPFPLWDFSGYSSVTTDDLPVPASRREMRFYWDSSHFKEEVGDWVLDRLFSTTCPGHPVPADFGRPLTPQSLEGDLAATREGRDAYERAHPQDLAALRRMISEAKAERAGPATGASG